MSCPRGKTALARGSPFVVRTPLGTCTEVMIVSKAAILVLAGAGSHADLGWVS